MAEEKQSFRISQCRSCGADIVWVLTRKGKRMPLDVKPSDEGKFIFDGEHDGTPKVQFVPEKGRELRPEERFTSHFTTCPNAEERRR